MSTPTCERGNADEKKKSGNNRGEEIRPSAGKMQVWGEPGRSWRDHHWGVGFFTTTARRAQGGGKEFGRDNAAKVPRTRRPEKRGKVLVVLLAQVTITPQGTSEWMKTGGNNCPEAMKKKTRKEVSESERAAGTPNAPLAAAIGLMARSKYRPCARIKEGKRKDGRGDRLRTKRAFRKKTLSLGSSKGSARFRGRLAHLSLEKQEEKWHVVQKDVQRKSAAT